MFSQGVRQQEKCLVGAKTETFSQAQVMLLLLITKNQKITKNSSTNSEKPPASSSKTISKVSTHPSSLKLIKNPVSKLGTKPK
jgi:hypothetical protein